MAIAFVREKQREKRRLTNIIFFYGGSVTDNKSDCESGGNESQAEEKRRGDGDSITHQAPDCPRSRSPFNLCSGNENLEEKRSNIEESSLVTERQQGKMDDNVEKTV